MIRATLAHPKPPPGATGLRPIATGQLYYPGVRCPDCGGQHWNVGRISAECGWCDAALLLTSSQFENVKGAPQ